MSDRVRNSDEGRTPFDDAALEVPEFPTNFGTETELVVSDSIKVVDTASGGATVMEFRGGSTPAPAPLPTVPLGTMQLASNLSVNGGYVRSSNFVTGSAGWNIGYNGDAEFNNITARGRVEAGEGVNLFAAFGGFEVTDLVPNGRFESNTTGWTALGGATLAVDATIRKGPAGQSSMKVTAVGAAAIGAVAATGLSAMPVTPSTKYQVGCWVRTAVTGRTGTLRVRYYTAAGAASATVFVNVQSVVDTTTFFHLCGQVTTPADAAFAAIEVEWLACAAAEVHYVDEVVFAANQSPFGATSINAGWDYPSTSMTTFGSGSRSLALKNFGGGSAQVEVGTAYGLSGIAIPGYGTVFGQYLRVRAIAKSDATAQLASIRISFYDNTGASIVASGGTVLDDYHVVPASGAVGLIQCSAAVPATAAYFGVDIAVNGATTNTTVYFDELEARIVSKVIAGYIATATEGERIELVQTSTENVRYYTGDGEEFDNGRLLIASTGAAGARQGYLSLDSPNFVSLVGGAPSHISRLELRSETTDTLSKSLATLSARNVLLGDGAVSSVVTFQGRPKNGWVVTDSGILTPAVANYACSLTYANVTSMFFTVVKNWTNSALTFDIQGTAFSAAGGFAQVLGVRVNSVSYDCARLYINPANTHMTWSGGCTIDASVVPAGSYTVQLRTKSTAVPFANWSTDTNDFFRMRCIESWQD